MMRRRVTRTALPRHAVEHAQPLGVKTLVPSIALFERFGFGRCGELPNVACLDEVERSLSIMGRRL
jgi:L-amino acid N-acyltransferase YncA